MTSFASFWPEAEDDMGGGGPVAPLPAAGSGDARARSPLVRRQPSPGRARPPPAAAAAAPELPRHAGNRRRRRWANDHMIGVGLPGLDGDADDDAYAALGAPMQVEYASNFAKLMDAGNAEALDRFVECRGDPAPRRTRQPAGGAAPSAEACLRGVEKRARAFLTRAAGKAAQLAFVDALEGLLLRFLRAGDAPAAAELPHLLLQALDGGRPVVDPRTGWLHVPLRSGTVERLLLHGVAQYYGCTSQSTDDARGRRVTVVRRTRTSLAARPSLSGFLVGRPAKTLRAAPAAPAAPAGLPAPPAPPAVALASPFDAGAGGGDALSPPDSPRSDSSDWVRAPELRGDVSSDSAGSWEDVGGDGGPEWIVL